MMDSPTADRRRIRRHGILIGLALIVLWTGRGWAYIDPNAGGFLAQMVAPLLAVLASFIFYCRKQLARFFKSGTRKIEQNENQVQSEPDRPRD